LSLLKLRELKVEGFMEQANSELFVKYINNTNGKNVLCNYLKNELPKYNYTSLLDVGAGQGEFAIGLTSILKSVVAVEPNQSFAQNLREKNIKNLTVIEDTIQNYKTYDSYDIILLSYFLDLFQDKDIEIIMNKIMKLKSAKGIILGISYLPRCDWDNYAHIIINDLTIERKGGIDRVFTKLEKFNYYCSIMNIIDTEIYGKTLEDLYYNLSFFFKKNLEGYYSNIDRYIKILQKYSRIKDNRYSINVKEVIYEIRL
jgi:ubiquinone/menaquinone biosynthesis C-methylase UbiE